MANKEADENDSVDQMRRLLESSWNSDTMGVVPTNADAAASAAAEAIFAAREQQDKQLYMVDILLPQYDIRQGERLYDEVMAVEFCISLAKRLEGKSAIVVRDQKTLDTVTRILDAREDTDSVAYDEEEEDDDDGEGADEAVADVEFYDDFADFGTIGAESSSAPSGDDVDSFRDKVASSWDAPPAEKSEMPKLKVPSMAVPKQHRLTSMLGDATISKGVDMKEDVINAVREHGQPTEEEDTLIILSAASPEELIGIRGLVGKFDKTKQIVLVNCQLQPLPRELMSAETVYSVLPLVARPTQSDRDIFDSTKQDDEQTPPKVVVLRRYPSDWEVFVDSGSGFELAATSPGRKGSKGPPMTWVADRVKRHLQSRAGR